MFLLFVFGFKKIAIFVVLTYPASIFTKKAVSYTVLKIEKYYIQ